MGLLVSGIEQEGQVVWRCITNDIFHQPILLLSFCVSHGGFHMCCRWGLPGKRLLGSGEQGGIFCIHTMMCCSPETVGGPVTKVNTVCGVGRLIGVVRCLGFGVWEYGG